MPLERRVTTLPASVSLWVFVGVGLAWFAPAEVLSQTAVPPSVEQAPAGIEVLLENCLECHHQGDPAGGLDLSTRAAALEGGVSGSALDEDAALDSLLWTRVDAGEMPPEEPLDESSRQSLKKWLRKGATWPTEPLDRLARSTKRRAGRDWWAWQPIRTTNPPALEADAWSRNEVDRFVWQELRERGLEPAAPADPRTLVRRLYFDLVGLPPPHSVVQAFERNPTEQAWQSLVEELLASPQYGEHWGNHWLDVARFGESQGFEYNQPRRGAWHFRDWVISALNRDLPYDEFVRQQIAGDSAGGQSIAELAPLGFLVAGPHNTVLGISDAMRQTARQEELEEMVGTLSQAFLGLTVNCARCHDHKFDPITAEEYYRFIGTLAGVQHSGRTVPSNLPIVERNQLEQRANELRGQLDQAYAARGAVGSNSSNRARTMLPRAANEKGVRYRLELSLSPTVWADGSQATEAEDRLAVELRDNSRVRLGRQVFSPGAWREAEERQVFRPFALEYVGSGEGGLSLELGSEQFTGRFAGAVDWIVCRRGDGAEVWREEFVPLQGDSATGLQSATGAAVHCRRGLERWTLEGLNAAHLVEYRPGEFALQIFSGFPDGPAAPETVEEKAWATDLALLESRLKSIELFTVGSVQPDRLRVLHRGDVRQPGKEVEPAALSLIIGLDGDLKLGPAASDAERRERLAAWITHPENGLFHRVAVNRVWHHHFGAGLVEKTSDFGFNGGRPSHADLIEWLAAWFRQQGYSLKALHRLIVCSKTWQQSSLPTDNALGAKASEIDQGNRLLWRQNPRRLTAEALRDAMLLHAGVLDLTAGGEGYQDFVIEKIGDAHYYRHSGESEPSCWRRSVYRFRVRGDRSPLLESFDCPDPSATAPSRNITTTPTQALALWNGELVLELAERLASRVQAENPGGTPAEWASGMWRMVLQRDPLAQEVVLASEFIEKHGLESLGRVLLNANEFLLVD
ncbi:MAG: PSD1 and planctomycete cytochrome C domain-containing protein [Planctomycetota bacterium]